MITPEQLERPGYDTRDTLKDQRFANYFGGDPGAASDGVTPTDKAFGSLSPELQSMPSWLLDPSKLGSGITLDEKPVDYQALDWVKNQMSSAPHGESLGYMNYAVNNPVWQTLARLPDEYESGLGRFYEQNLDPFGQYFQRWGPGDSQEGGTFSYDPMEFAAGVAKWFPGMDQKYGIDLNAGNRFNAEQSAEAQASRDKDSFGLGDILGTVASLASLFVPGLQPLALAYNAYKAIDSGNPLAMVGSLANLGGFTNVLPPGVANLVSKGASFANAVNSGNPIGMLQSGLGLSNGALNSFNFNSGGNNMYDDWWSGDTGQGGSSWADFTSTPSGQADWDFLQGGNFGTDVYGAGGNPLSDFGQWGTGSNPYGGFDDWGTGSGGANPSAGGLNLGSIFNSGNLNKGLDFLNKNMNTIGGLAGIYQKYQQGQQMKNLTNQMMGGFDPFGSQRPQYQAQLAQTYTNPALYLNSPEYKAIEGRLRKELERKDAAGGRRSQYGNRALELQDAALANLFKQRGQLGEFAGAGIAPNAGVGQAAQQALAASQKNSGNILGDIFRVMQERKNQQQPLLDLSMF